MSASSTVMPSSSSVGTGASLFAAALFPGPFRSLVVGAGGAAVPLQLGGVL
jgi:hypothetical protein